VGVALHPDDEAFLQTTTASAAAEGGFVCVVFSQFPLTVGLVPEASDLLVRLPAGFPDSRPDMFWFADRVTRADGKPIPAIDLPENYLGRTWYRWSRHVGNGWRPGVDNLQSYIAYVRSCLAHAAT
jgi:hypothetical protein